MADVLFSVDVETDGPIPGDFSLLSIGACLVERTEVSFYVEMQPIFHQFDPEAMQVNGLDRDRLLREGQPPKVAMESFAEWVKSNCADGNRPVYVALNVSFDWSFTHWYFQHYLSFDPFGHSAWDIRAHFAGYLGTHSWSASSGSVLCEELSIERLNTHNALADAQEQAKIFRLLQQKSEKARELR